MIRDIAFAATLLFMSSSNLSAQRPLPVGVKIAVAPSSAWDSTSSDSQSINQIALSACAQDRILGVAVGAVAGAGMGWLLYTVSFGALADSHGAGYDRDRARWMWGGAAFGSVLAALAPSPRPDCR